MNAPKTEWQIPPVCPSKWLGSTCTRPSGHDGLHSDLRGFTKWPDDAAHLMALRGLASIPAKPSTPSVEELADLRETVILEALKWRAAKDISPAQRQAREEQLDAAVDAYEQAQRAYLAGRGGR